MLVKQLDARARTPRDGGASRARRAAPGGERKTPSPSRRPPGGQFSPAAAPAGGPHALVWTEGSLHGAQARAFTSSPTSGRTRWPALRRPPPRPTVAETEINDQVDSNGQGTVIHRLQHDSLQTVSKQQHHLDSFQDSLLCPS